MRTISFFGRLCLRQGSLTRVSQALPRSRRKITVQGRPFSHRSRPPVRPIGLTVLLASLSPAAFVALSEDDNGDGATSEERMLEVSREEIRKKIPESYHGLQRISRHVYLAWDAYFWEPLCTTMRFLHLVVIFVPVIVAVPVIWMGSRQKDKNNERSGTIWWYRFLVSSMERAGPAFIKVGIYQGVL